MKLKLYQFYTSPFCAKVRKILEYKGLDFEIVEVDYIDRHQLLAASGQIMVPALTLTNGDTVVDSNRIVQRLGKLYPEPTILPPGWRGLHQALTRYFETEVEDVLFRVAMGDELEYYRRLGPERLAFYRLIRERKYGDGFCERMVHEHQQNLERARRVLAPLDEALADKAFLLGRIGLADFALYGQLWYLGFTGELRIPAEFENLRAYFGRIDRISAAVEEVRP